MYSESACSFRGEYFESDDECELFTENATQYGLGILITYFIVNVRQAKTRGITNEICSHADRNVGSICRLVPEKSRSRV